MLIMPFMNYIFYGLICIQKGNRSAPLKPYKCNCEVHTKIKFVAIFTFAKV